MMQTSTDGCQPCSNAQLAGDGTPHLIVAADLSAHPSDQGQLHAVLDQVEATVTQRPPPVLAEADYGNERDLALLEANGSDATWRWGGTAHGRRAPGHGPHGGQAGPR